MAKLQTLTAIDPRTGARFTRKTARHYVAAIVVTTPNGLPTLVDASLCQQWASRPDLAQAALAKALRSEPTARLAPVANPEPEAHAQAQAETPHPCSAEGVAAEALAALAELGATPEPTPRTPAEAQAAQGLAALRQARIDRAQALARHQALRPCSPHTLAGMAQAIRQAQGLPPRVRPLLPGEALPPEPPAWGGPAPVLPTLA